MNITIYFLGGLSGLSTHQTRTLFSRVGGEKPKAFENGSNPNTELCQGVRIFPYLPYLDQSPVQDFDTTAAMMEYGERKFPTFDEEQKTFLAEPFQAVPSQVAQWRDFDICGRVRLNLQSPQLLARTF
ncbi:hypothetical protein VTL71DRAFT_10812 [Oculimacula yallundae]|uniref:Uncharacterized protein n=1 Tax=Oculimacula yallundae TaxID=86028 RepID=A0ABR4CWE2_9HELO